MSERDLFRLFQKPEKPPLGLETIRAWIRKPRPLLRSAWDWVPHILSRLPQARDFVKKQRAPAAKLLRRVAARGEPLAKGAAWFGRMLVELGASGRAAAAAFRDPHNEQGETAAKIEEGADAVRRLGRSIAAIASVADKVFAIVEGIGKLLQPKAPASVLPEKPPKPAETPDDTPPPRPSPPAESESPRGQLPSPEPRPVPQPEPPPEPQPVPQPEPPTEPAPPEPSPAPRPSPAPLLPEPARPEPPTEPAPPEPSPAPRPSPAPLPPEPARPEPQPAPPEPSPDLLPPEPAPPEPQPEPQRPEPLPAPLPPEPAPPDPPTEPQPAPPDSPADPLPPEPAPDPDPATSRPVESRKAAPPSPPPKPALPDLTDLPKVLHRRVLALSQRPLREVLRVLILDICLLRESTAAELAGWLSMHQPSLVARHIRPLLKADLLKLKFPDRPSSPQQAYQTRKDRWPPKN